MYRHFFVTVFVSSPYHVFSLFSSVFSHLFQVPRQKTRVKECSPIVNGTLFLEPTIKVTRVVGGVSINCTTRNILTFQRHNLSIHSTRRVNVFANKT